MFGIKKTIIAQNDYSNAQQQIALAANAPIMAAELEKQLIQMDTRVGSKDKNEQNREQELLGLITNYCQKNKAVLREFPETVIFNKENLLVETNQLVIAGNFSTLLNFVYLLEQKSNLGKVTSTHYQLKKDIKSKEMVLTATIYLQNVKKKENEK